MEVSENSVILNMTDPDAKVVDVEFTDASGGPLRSGSSMKTGDIGCLNLKNRCPPGREVDGLPRNAEGIVEDAFKLQDIALP